MKRLSFRALIMTSFVLLAALTAQADTGDLLSEKLNQAISNLDKAVIGVKEIKKTEIMNNILLKYFRVGKDEIEKLQKKKLGFGDIATLLALAEQTLSYREKQIPDSDIQLILDKLSGLPGQWWKKNIDLFHGSVEPIIIRIKRLTEEAEKLQKTAFPKVIKITPAEIFPGKEITIRGEHFGEEMGKVLLGAKLLGESDKYELASLAIKRWSNTEIKAIGPVGKKNYGTIVVKNDRGWPSGKKPVEMMIPRTERPFNIDFIAGAEYTLEEKDEKKNFSSPFFHVGVRVDNKLHENFKSFANIRLTSTTSEENTSGDGQLSSERSFELMAGFFFPFHLFPNKETEIGPILKIGGQTAGNNANFFQQTFYGLRFLQTSPLFNGAYSDVGVGYSGNFRKRKRSRMKFEGFLPLDGMGLNIFFSSTIETDFGSEPDRVTVVFGTFFETRAVSERFRAILGLPEG